MKKKTKNKIKNVILKTITNIAGIALILGISSADSESWIPIVVVMVSVLWIYLMSKANEEENWYV